MIYVQCYLLSERYQWHSDKKSACQCKRHKRRGFDPWVGKIPWRRAWQPTPVFLPGKFHGQRSLVGYCPWGHRRVRHDWATENTHTVMLVGLQKSKLLLLPKAQSLCILAPTRISETRVLGDVEKDSFLLGQAQGDTLGFRLEILYVPRPPDCFFLNKHYYFLSAPILILDNLHDLAGVLPL